MSEATELEEWEAARQSGGVGRLVEAGEALVSAYGEQVEGRGDGLAPVQHHKLIRLSSHLRSARSVLRLASPPPQSKPSPSSVGGGSGGARRRGNGPSLRALAGVQAADGSEHHESASDIIGMGGGGRRRLIDWPSGSRLSLGSLLHPTPESLAAVSAPPRPGLAAGSLDQAAAHGEEEEEDEDDWQQGGKGSYYAVGCKRPRSGQGLHAQSSPSDDDDQCLVINYR